MLCTKEWRSTAWGCGQQIEGHESFLVKSGLDEYFMEPLYTVYPQLVSDTGPDREMGCDEAPLLKACE